MSEKDNERAKDQARLQLESIKVMVARLSHCDNCSDPECNLPDKEIFDGLEEYYQEGKKASTEDREKYHDRDDAEEDINNDPLSVEVRTNWHDPGDTENKPTEYNILLCTGGPAVRIIGDLDDHGWPDNANLEYQDWFTSWARYPLESSDEDDLLTYARHFYFDSL